MSRPDAATLRHAPRGQRRLRTRIIVSFALLGFGLTLMFAVAMLYLRNRLESQLIETTLQDEVASLVRHVETRPTEAPFFRLFDARTFSDENAYKINPLYRTLAPGMHEVREEDSDGVTLSRIAMGEVHHK